MERVEPVDRQLRFLLEAFGKLQGPVLLNLSHNQLEGIWQCGIPGTRYGTGGVGKRGELTIQTLTVVLPTDGYLANCQIFGSFWYYLAVNKLTICWKHRCERLNGCQLSPTKYITINKPTVQEILNKSCSIKQLGLFEDALASHIIEHKGLWQRVFVCLLWGLFTICSFASSHVKCTWDEWETAFRISVIIYSVTTIGFFMSNLSLIRGRRLRRSRRRRRSILPQRLFSP